MNDVIGSVRQVIQDFLAPELRQHRTELVSVRGEVASVRSELAATIETVESKIDAVESRLDSKINVVDSKVDVLKSDVPPLTWVLSREGDFLLTKIAALEALTVAPSDMARPVLQNVMRTEKNPRVLEKATEIAARVGDSTGN